LPQPCFSPPSLDGAAALGEKPRYPLPMVVSKPFQCYYRRAKELREGHSVKWNDALFFDSLKATKLSVGYTNKRATVVKPPAKKVAVPPAMKKTETTPVKQVFFRKGFLNLPPIVSVSPALLHEVNNVGVVGPSSPPKWLLKWFLPIP
jgi:hypothetical protein